MSQFYIPSTSQSSTSTPAIRSPSPNNSALYGDEDSDEDTLPYPTELPRKEFLAPDFDPQTYLSTLRNRHQTLEDLRSDLRQRSQLLNKELLDLVNGEYEDFLSLGEDLKGGEEKVEGVRVGLLGFGREVEGIRQAVDERVSEVGPLLRERKEVRKGVVLGRRLLELDAAIEELQESLGIKDGDEFGDVDDEDDELESTETTPSVPLRRLQKHTQQYLLIVRLAERIGSSHPFLRAQQSRLDEARKTLTLDLATALRQAKIEKAPDAILSVVRMYGDLGAQGEGLKVLQSRYTSRR